jgi:succinate dehydrogenase/fumarate reductase flavoprotein subunit
MLVAAQAITHTALSRRESRGAHYRTDFPRRDPALDGTHSLVRVQSDDGRSAHVEKGAAVYA